MLTDYVSHPQLFGSMNFCFQAWSFPTQEVALITQYEISLSDSSWNIISEAPVCAYIAA